MALHYPAASSSTSQPSPSRLSFNAAGPRTSSKRSFDEYGHTDVRSSSQPSASASSSSSSAQITHTMPTSGMPHDAIAIMAVDPDPAFGDSSNNLHNTRFKRRRNSLLSDNDNAVRKSLPVRTPVSLTKSVLIRSMPIACPRYSSSVTDPVHPGRYIHQHFRSFLF